MLVSEFIISLPEDIGYSFLVNMNKVSLNIGMQDFVDTDFQINWGNK